MRTVRHMSPINAFEGTDKVTAKEIWRLPKSPGESSNLATPTWCIMGGKGGFLSVYDIMNGELTSTIRGGGMSRLLLGDILISSALNQSWWSLQNTLDDKGHKTGYFTT